MAAGPGGAERYFTRWYKPDVKGRPCEDFCVLQHSNRRVAGGCRLDIQLLGVNQPVPDVESPSIPYLPLLQPIRASGAFLGLQSQRQEQNLTTDYTKTGRASGSWVEARICVITLAEAHPLLQSGKTIKNINYQISANCSRLQNKVSGKSKRGAQFLTELAPLCRISSSDGEEYTIYSCIRGRLIEVNENILSNPALLQEKPSTEGYIAVVLPKFEESKSITQGLLTQKEYEEVLMKRRSSAS
ncbi:hypothetical protein DV515_00000062 [Chloebia gouldiae]|uniref:Protein Abitram n=3 Tax=Passeriformes TaxID=9126 RepID=A0A3L8T1Y1_CHLGU|nr:hypothetical protein DV515_00000062 [Chloebia gouldiae]